MSVTALPRSLDPLPGESLPGFVLRLAHRLEVSPTRLAALTGLDRGRGQSTLASSVILALDPQTTTVFAHATRLTTAEVTGLTLASLADRYPPLDPKYAGRTRQVHGMLIQENWIYARSTRYCPGCLAGDGSLIQRRHGGAWSKLWRLPVVFACPVHRRLLHHLCPSCRAPAHQRRAGSPQLLPLAAHPVTHPAACRNPTTATAPYQACGQRLDRDGGTGPFPLDERALDLQHGLLALLAPAPGQEVLSVAEPTTPGRYFVDLRILTALLAASWPVARDGVDPRDASRIDDHVSRTRERITAAQTAGGRVHPIRLYDRPPLDAGDTYAMLTAADRLLSGDQTSLGAVLREMFDTAPFARAWTRGFLTGEGRCSPGLQIAAGTQAGARHVIRQAGLPGRALQPPPRPVDFGLEHIPHYLPTHWCDTYFADLGADRQTWWLRRAVPVLLARTPLGGGVRDATTRLGLPSGAGRLAVARLNTRLRDQPAAQAALAAGMQALTGHLHTAVHRIDYGRRRRVMAGWTLDDDRWLTMTEDLVGRPVNGRASWHIDWGERKQLLATTWIWTRVTEGELHFAPLLRPDPTRPKQGSDLSVYIHARWPFLARGQGHYQQLRQRLDAHAIHLAQQIDEQDDQPDDSRTSTTGRPVDGRQGPSRWRDRPVTPE